MNSPPKPGDFPIGSLESRTIARMRAERIRATQKRIEIISNVQRPHYALPPGTNNSMPYAHPWQEMKDGILMRIVYHPGEWHRVPVESVPVCSGCGTPFRKAERQVDDSVWFESDCVAKHVSDGSK